jgi:hypothetical protein
MPGGLDRAVPTPAVGPMGPLSTPPHPLTAKKAARLDFLPPLPSAEAATRGSQACAEGRRVVGSISIMLASPNLGISASVITI